MRHNLPQIDYHVIDACNMACDFCAHYSNFKVPAKIMDVEDIRKEWSYWAERIKPEGFHIIGGEPMLHPELPKIVWLAKKIWKDSKIKLYSNCVLRHKHPKLKHLLNDCTLVMGLHLGIEKDQKLLKDTRRYYAKTRVHIAAVDGKNTWRQFYRIDSDGSPQPFNDGNPRASWENCSAKECVVLKDNKLWKCPQVAYARTANITWFDGYDACGPDDDISEFLQREEESCCANCPATPQLVPHGEEWMVKRSLPILDAPT